MTDFATSLKSSELDTALSLAGRAPFTHEAADLAIQITKFEPISPALIAFTHMCENGFGISPALPNINNKASSIWNWDIGPFQINLGWAMRGIFNRDFLSDGLLFNEVFGVTFYLPDGVTPCPFSGIPLANGRLASRRLLSGRPATGAASERTRAINYTGPAHQQKRADLWDQLHERFSLFFTIYK